MTQPTARSLPLEGDIIAGKYRVERVLGAGGMGVVVAAHHIRLDEKVALKFLLPQATLNPEAISRFEREARAASKIKNEHVARVTDVGVLESGSPYMVMEYLEGGDLSGMLARRGPLPYEMAVDFVLQACEAIGEAHTLGIVHRDLKPANLFCITRTDGHLFIKVLDFGISKLTNPDAVGHSLTRTTAFMGSPLYMSPEQMQNSKGVDARTDIWSLGVILFELATGKPPFDAEAVTELAIKIATSPHTPMRSFRGDAPAGMERVVGKCLEKDRSKRYQTVGELATALRELAPAHAHASVDRIVGTERLARGSGATPAHAAESYAASMLGTAPETAASFGRTGAPTQSAGGGGRRAAAGIAVLAVALGGALLLRSRAPSGTPPGTEVVANVVPPAAAPPDPAAAAAPPEAPTVHPAAPPRTAEPPVSSVAGNAHAGAPHPSGTPGSPPPARRAAALAQVATPAPRTPSPTAAASARAPNCNPPYVIDSAGQHQYKPECL